MQAKLVLLLTCSVPLLAFLVVALRDIGSDLSAAAPLHAGGSAAATPRGGAGGKRLSQAGAPGRGKLRFRPDGTFKILQITDLHYGEDAEKDAKSDEVRRQNGLGHRRHSAAAVLTHDMHHWPGCTYSLPPCPVTRAGAEICAGG